MKKKRSKLVSPLRTRQIYIHIFILVALQEYLQYDGDLHVKVANEKAEIFTHEDDQILSRMQRFFFNHKEGEAFTDKKKRYFIR